MAWRRTCSQDFVGGKGRSRSHWSGFATCEINSLFMMFVTIAWVLHVHNAMLKWFI